MAKLSKSIKQSVRYTTTKNHTTLVVKGVRSDRTTTAQQGTGSRCSRELEKCKVKPLSAQL